MRLTIVPVLIFAMLGVSGCLTFSQPIAPPVTPEQLQQMRDEYRRTDRAARVGLVMAVLPSANLASVGDVPVKDFTVGDIITFVDSNGKTLTMGTVEAINGNSLTVKYVNPSSAGRAPLEGDAAVRAIH
jgi:hypothetical protein